MKDDEKSIFDDDDEIDTFADAGLDYDELEFMDPDERREVLLLWQRLAEANI